MWNIHILQVHPHSFIVLVALFIFIITSGDIISPCSETLYSPEELLGMLLHQAKEFAQNSAGQPINEAVLTVPGFFNQAERRALLKAADLAGLKVLQLMNDYTAGKFSIQYLKLLQHDTASDLSTHGV
jgi:molecular chaperone DnaK (HSP70)